MNLLGKSEGGCTYRVMEKQWAALVALPAFPFPLLSCPPFSHTHLSTLFSFCSLPVHSLLMSCRGTICHGQHRCTLIRS